MLYAKQDGNTPMSVFVLPATPEAWDAMVEMGAKAMFEANLKQELSLNGGVGFWLPWEKKTEPGKDNYRDQSRAVLTALALVRPTQKGGA